MTTLFETGLSGCLMRVGIWSNTLESKLESAIMKTIPSIFKILVDQELITLEEMTIKLDEYTSNVMDDPESYGLRPAV